MSENILKIERFSKEEVNGLVGFSDILKRIHIRLISEGYTIKEGKFYKPEHKIKNSAKIYS